MNQKIQIASTSANRGLSSVWWLVGLLKMDLVINIPYIYIYKSAIFLFEVFSNAFYEFYWNATNNSQLWSYPQGKTKKINFLIHDIDHTCAAYLASC